MISNDSLMLYAKLAGFRLAVLANRACCNGDFSRELYDRLIDGLDAAIDRVREQFWQWSGDFSTVAMSAPPISSRARARFFGRLTIDLLDELDIDYDTREYRINGGRWTNALMVDDTGVHVDYPDLVLFDDQELGSAGADRPGYRRETGLAIPGPIVSITATSGCFIRILPCTVSAARK